MAQRDARMSNNSENLPEEAPASCERSAPHEPMARPPPLDSRFMRVPLPVSRPTALPEALQQKGVADDANAGQGHGGGKGRGEGIRAASHLQ